ncbi:MAG: hypothetical protein V7636_2369 [Actinomycetota bacterium]
MKLAGVLAALLLTIGAAVALTGADDSNGGDSPPVALGAVRLVSVDSCDDLLAWYRKVAESTDVGYLSGVAYGAGGDMRVMTGGTAGSLAVPEAATAGGAATARDSAASTANETASDKDAFSGTNVQEKGVDEPDTVKTNGKLLVSAGPDALSIVDVSGDAPKLVSTMPLEQGGTELLLSGDHVVTLTNVWRPDPSAQQPQSEGDVRVMMMPVQGSQVTVVSSIDVSDPAHPRLVERRELEGSYRTARLTGTTARIVLVTYPKLPVPGPGVNGPTEAITQQNMRQWRTQAIASMSLHDWAPLADGDCSSVARTAQPEGLATTSVLTLDVDRSLDTVDTDSVVADAGTIYASTDRLVLATSRWSQFASPTGQATTELHAFDLSGDHTSYVGSGSVPGYLLNQFAVSEHDGHLRVATTQEPPWTEQLEGQAQLTHSGISVLDERAGALIVVGQIDGLGVTERIQAVRYIGDLAYVVTFRQKDPLYVVDLSDPTAPRVAGQLKVPGYSAYLHPIDGDRLVGVGQDATDDGQVLGTQVATFDVHDPAAPTRIDATRIDHGSSQVEYDHRAFLWWDASRTIVLPLQIFDPGIVEPMPAPVPDCPPDADCATAGSGTSSSGSAGAPAPDAKTAVPPQPQARPFTGAVVFHVGDDGKLREVGRLTHDGHGAPNDGTFSFTVSRSIVIGDSLYTVSDGGVLRSDLSSLADQGFAAFPVPDYSKGGQPIPVDG